MFGLDQTHCGGELTPWGYLDIPRGPTGGILQVCYKPVSELPHGNSSCSSNPVRDTQSQTVSKPRMAPAFQCPAEMLMVGGAGLLLSSNEVSAHP